jgi:hypothetical protein
MASVSLDRAATLLAHYINADIPVHLWGDWLRSRRLLAGRLLSGVGLRKQSRGAYEMGNP